MFGFGGLDGGFHYRVAGLGLPNQPEIVIDFPTSCEKIGLIEGFKGCYLIEVCTEMTNSTVESCFKHMDFVVW